MLPNLLFFILAFFTLCNVVGIQYIRQFLDLENLYVETATYTTYTYIITMNLLLLASYAIVCSLNYSLNVRHVCCFLPSFCAVTKTGLFN